MRKKTSPIWALPTKEFHLLVANSNTITQILAFFGMQNKGGNFRTLKARMLQEQIDSSHFTKNRMAGWIKTPKPLAEVLVEQSQYSRTNLKKRLIREGHLKEQCYICGQGTIWLGKPLSLILDHINGVSDDNRLVNLRLICPNCNGQTATFAGRNARKKRECKICKRPIVRGGYCYDCRHISRRKCSRPTKEELAILLWQKPTMLLAKDFGVSDKAIEKWAKKYNIEKPPRGYWRKVECGQIKLR